MKRLIKGEHYLIYYGKRERIGVFIERNKNNNTYRCKIIAKTPVTDSPALWEFNYKSCHIIKHIPKDMLTLEKLRMEQINLAQERYNDKTRI